MLVGSRCLTRATGWLYAFALLARCLAGGRTTRAKEGARACPAALCRALPRADAAPSPCYNDVRAALCCAAQGEGTEGGTAEVEGGEELPQGVAEEQAGQVADEDYNLHYGWVGGWGVLCMLCMLWYGA